MFGISGISFFARTNKTTVESVDTGSNPKKSGSDPNPKKSGSDPNPKKSGSNPNPKKSGGNPNPKKSGSDPKKKSGSDPNPKKSGSDPNPKKSGSNPNPKKSGSNPNPKKSGSNPNPKKSGSVERESFYPSNARVSEKTIADFLVSKPSRDLGSIPGVGNENKQLLRNAGVGTCNQLIGVFLALDDEDATPVEVADKFYTWLRDVGINSHRTSIVLSLAEKIDRFSPGFYDAGAYLEESDVGVVY